MGWVAHESAAKSACPACGSSWKETRAVSPAAKSDPPKCGIGMQIGAPAAVPDLPAPAQCAAGRQTPRQRACRPPPPLPPPPWPPPRRPRQQGPRRYGRRGSWFSCRLQRGGGLWGVVGQQGRRTSMAPPPCAQRCAASRRAHQITFSPSPHLSIFFPLLPFFHFSPSAPLLPY